MFKVLTSEQISKIKTIGFPLKDVSPAIYGQPFGANWIYFYKELGMKGHNGIDFLAPTGREAIACFDGKITVSGFDSEGGNEVRIETTEFDVEGQKIKLEAVYYHLLKDFVVTSSWTQRGQVIAQTDNTGKWTTGPHLHFGIKVIYRQEDGTYTKDYKNGYFGAIDPALLFETVEYQLWPVDYRYRQPRDLKREMVWKARSYWWVVRKLGRRPTQREMDAWIYGKWDFETVREPTYFPVWTQVTKEEHQKKMKKLGIEINF